MATPKSIGVEIFQIWERQYCLNIESEKCHSPRNDVNHFNYLFTTVASMFVEKLLCSTKLFDLNFV